MALRTVNILYAALLTPIGSIRAKIKAIPFPKYALFLPHSAEFSTLNTEAADVYKLQVKVYHITVTQHLMKGNH
jgi:hypothetical protein